MGNFVNQSINLAILGLGTVGTGIVNLLKDNAKELSRRSGYDINITHVGTRRHRISNKAMIYLPLLKLITLILSLK